MSNQKRDKDGKFANGPVSPPPTPEWADKVIAEAETLDNPADRYNHMVEALRNLTTPPTDPDPAPVTNAQHHQANKLAVRYGEHDLDRELVHFGWDGNSNSIYLYRDQRDLPDWQRTHIIKHRVETPVVEETKEREETCDWCDKPAVMYAPAYGGGQRLVCIGHSKATLSRADGTAPCTICHQPSILVVQRPNGSWSACDAHIGGLQADAAKRFNRQAEIDAFNIAREASIRGEVTPAVTVPPLCPSCEEPLDSQAHQTACDIVTLTKQRKRDGLPVGSTKAERENLTSGVTAADLDAREAEMAATPRRRSGPAAPAARVPDGTWQVGDVVKVHSDADGQPITFEYKVVTRKPKTVVIRMIRMDGSLGAEQTFRVKTYEDGREYIALNKYQSAFAPKQ